MRSLYVLVTDLLLVIVFAIVGRTSHSRGLSLDGIVETAWPFLVACLIAWAITAVLGWNSKALSSGCLIWLITLAGGMGLRVVSGGSIAISFLIVAGISLAILLLGWRAVAALASRRST